MCCHVGRAICSFPVVAALASKQRPCPIETGHLHTPFDDGSLDVEPDGSAAEPTQTEWAMLIGISISRKQDTAAD